MIPRSSDDPVDEGDAGARALDDGTGSADVDWICFERRRVPDGVRWKLNAPNVTPRPSWRVLKEGIVTGECGVKSKEPKVIDSLGADES